MVKATIKQLERKLKDAKDDSDGLYIAMLFIIIFSLIFLVPTFKDINAENCVSKGGIIKNYSSLWGINIKNYSSLWGINKCTFPPKIYVNYCLSTKKVIPIRPTQTSDFWDGKQNVTDFEIIEIQPAKNIISNLYCKNLINDTNVSILHSDYYSENSGWLICDVLLKNETEYTLAPKRMEINFWKIKIDYEKFRFEADEPNRVRLVDGVVYNLNPFAYVAINATLKEKTCTLISVDEYMDKYGECGEWKGLGLKGKLYDCNCYSIDYDGSRVNATKLIKENNVCWTQQGDICFGNQPICTKKSAPANLVEVMR